MNKLFLVEERSRLGLKAKEVAEYVGVAIPTQSNYEQGKRSPDTQYLAKLAELGFDINYVITGKRANFFLSAQEKRLIALFGKAPKEVQDFILGSLDLP